MFFCPMRNKLAALSALGTGAGLLMVLAIAGEQPANAERDRKLLAGAWRLTYELRLKPSGQITTPFGLHASGRLLYETNGQMSVQLMRPNVKRFASDDPLRASDAEAALAWRNYIGYWGTYTVDTRLQTVTHHIEGSSIINWAGQSQTRAFRLSGDTLTLDADSAAWHSHLTWKRMRSQPRVQ
jgi:hypothetical protein